MKAIVTGDIHLTTRPGDDYRWGVFHTIRRQVAKRKADAVILLGDLTHQKDAHPARLVNRLVEEIREVSAMANVFILKGNHDYVDPSTPFFKFIGGLSENVEYITSPVVWPVRGAICAMLPHTRNWRTDWESLFAEAVEVDFVFMHQPVRGARSENGVELDGMPGGLIEDIAPRATIISGDVHVPQKVGRVIYCGAPHPVNFGDSFTPRLLSISGSKVKSIRRKTIRKVSVVLTDPDDLAEEDLAGGDQVKVGLLMRREEFVDWPERRARLAEVAEEMGVILRGAKVKEVGRRRRLKEDPETATPTEAPHDALARFSKARKMSRRVRASGEEILRELIHD